jgi:DNA-binding MarR family transcriptional regulator
MKTALAELPCACATVRRAARVVTLLYDDEMRGRLEASQFALMSVLEKNQGGSQAAIGRALGLDKTTLSRNLKLLKRNGWIENAPGRNQRERGFVLTSSGKKILKSAQPHWSRAQARLRAAMTEQQWNAMWQAFRDVTDVVHQLRTRRSA